MSDSLVPPKSDGGNAKYAVIGLLLIGGGGAGLWALTSKAPPPPPPPPAHVVQRDAGPPIATTPSVGATIELPPELPDSGPPPDVSNAPHIRYVTRYVNECSGTLTDPSGVQRTAQSNYGALRACYEHELRANPSLRGGLTAQLKILPTGHLETVRVATAMNNQALVECVKRALMRVTFPPSRNGCAIAEVRFNFTPRD